MGDIFTDGRWMKLYRLLYGSLSVFAVVYGVQKYMGIPVHPIWLLLFSCGFSGAVYMLAESRYRRFLWPVLGAAVILALAAGKIRGISYGGIVRKAFDWMDGYRAGAQSFHVSYAAGLAAIICLCNAVVFYVLGKGRLLRALSAAVLLGGCIGCTAADIDIPKMSAVCSLACLISVCLEGAYVWYNENKGAEYNNAVVFLVPVTLILSVVILCMPAYKSPIQWKIVKGVFHSVVNTLEDMTSVLKLEGNGSDGLYTVNLNGYGDGDSILGGDLITADRTLLKIKKKKANYSAAYLTGSVKSQYTGDRWICGDAEPADADEHYRLDLYEKLYYLYQSGLPASDEVLLSRSINLDITYHKIKTKSLFYPSGCWYMGSVPDFEWVSYYGGNMVFPKAKKEGMKYSAAMIEWNEQHPVLVEYLRNGRSQAGLPAKGDIYDLKSMQEDSLFSECVKELYLNLDYFNNTLPKLLKGRNERIQEQYGTLPEQLPGRVYDLAEDIVRGCTNDYDRAEVIRAYLQKYDYTRSPGAVPETEDFTDYFLFEGKKGYCTYFASAMAVLSRCAGIPSRYVEGLRVTYNKKKDGEYLVSSSAAHAWTEIYLEGFGWLVMDATPGCDTKEQGNAVWRKSEESREAVSTAGPVYSPLPAPDAANGYHGEKSAEEAVQNTRSIIWIMAGAVLGAVFIFSCALLLKCIRLTGRYRSQDAAGRVFYDIRELLYYCRAAGADTESPATVSELMEQLSGLESDTNIALSQALHIFEKARYSDIPVLEEDAVLVRHALDEMKACVKKNTAAGMLWLRICWILKTD